jgi:hypothetical protein
VAGLLEQPVRARFRLADLGGRMALRLGFYFADLVARRAQHLGALALALLPVALDLALPLLQLALPAADLFLRAPDLGRRCGLSIALDRVGHLRSGADHVQRVHAHGVPARLDLAAARRRLEDAELHLELRRVPPERLERLRDAFRVVAAVRQRRQIVDARERRERSLLCSFGRHQVRSIASGSVGVPSRISRSRS